MIDKKWIGHELPASVVPIELTLGSGGMTGR
ncbi:hypothetical protein H6CHR_03922 [Variovorax sp. PBL-H6]|nr:hypothetical protein H6CHR_03922 [Variovorax sp. PBL-H6]